MTKETHAGEDSYIVCVKAVVMTSDDSSGWDGFHRKEGGIGKVTHPDDKSSFSSMVNDRKTNW